METKGNYFLAGVFTLAGWLGIVLFIAWMMSAGEVSGKYKKLLIYFPSNVNGLSEGSQVAYRGVPVGNVVKVRLDPMQPEYALVLTHIQIDTPLHVATSAVMGNVGITGLTYIELETKNHDSPKLRLVPGRDYFVLRGTESRLDQLLDNVPVLIEKFTAVGNQLLGMLSNQNIDSTSKTLVNIESITRNFALQQKNINQILGDTRDTMHSFQTNTASSFNDLNRFLQEGQNAATDVKDLAKSLEDSPSSLLYQQKYNGYHVQK